MKSQLLVETLQPSESNIILETSNDTKSYYLNGIFMTAKEKNRNGRIYDLNEMKTVVESANRQIKETNGLLGELDHPANRLNTALDRVSHVITELWMDGINACGRAKLLDTPMGKIAQEIVKAGVKLGVSSRGTGQVSESGYVSQFALSTIDLVVVPSAPNAMPTAVYESLEYANNNNQILSLAEAVREDAAAQKYFEAEILKFINEILMSK